jgi:hypothetical protein
MLLGLASSLGACAAVDQLGAGRMRDVPTEQLCEWRGNPISGRQMMRELARRGEACAPPGTIPAQTASAAMPASRPDEITPIPAPTEALPKPPAEASPPEHEAEEVQPQGRMEASMPIAPLVTSACAERVIRRGGEAAASPKLRAVSFTNRCGFPIKVLYAGDRSKILSHTTALVQPGEQTGFARIEDDFDLPGYVVCSYANAQPSVPCRIGVEHH